MYTNVHIPKKSIGPTLWPSCIHTTPHPIKAQISAITETTNALNDGSVNDPIKSKMSTLFSQKDTHNANNFNCLTLTIT